MNYIGRFAPSPTGPLHFGSLVAALASYLDAKHHKGTWLLRIEDLDPPRESAEAPAQIVEQLRAFGLVWDGDILFQSSRLAHYQQILDQLTQRDLTYPCTCSRKSTPAIYPGTCRNQTVTDKPFSVRLKLPPETLSTDDRRLGHLIWEPDEQVGDFIIKRKDGLFAYQLAVVVDDIDQNITHIVRGIDLLDSTPWQLALYRILGVDSPQYLHIPIVVDDKGAKLSKQTQATPVSTTDPVPTLRQALKMLGQNSFPGTQYVDELLAVAIENWDTSRLPVSNELLVPAGYR